MGEIGSMVEVVSGKINPPSPLPHSVGPLPVSKRSGDLSNTSGEALGKAVRYCIILSKRRKPCRFLAVRRAERTFSPGKIC